jgi:hypothetical protein
VTAAGDHQDSSNQLVDTNVGPSTTGNGITADLLGAPADSSDSLIDADAGQHQGESLVVVNAANNADQFQFPALDGIGADSLVGETGDLAGATIGDGSIDLLPVSAMVNDTTLLDLDAAGGLDSGAGQPGDGTHVIADTSPLQASII